MHVYHDVVYSSTCTYTHIYIAYVYTNTSTCTYI